MPATLQACGLHILQPMPNPAFPPSQAPFHGAFAQGRTEPEVINLFHEWVRLTTDENGEMQGRPLEGFFTADTQLIAHYTIRLNGKPVRQRFSLQTSPNRWSTLGADYRSFENESIPEGTIPKGSVELQILRYIENGWLEQLSVRNNSIFPERFELNICLDVLIGDMEYEEEMKKQDGAKHGSLPPQISVGEKITRLAYDHFFGKRARTPVEELQEISAEKTPHDGDDVTRGLDITLELDAPSKIRKEASFSEHTEITVRGELGGREEARLIIRFEPRVDGFQLRIPESSIQQPSIPFPHPLIRELDGPSFNSSNGTVNFIVSQALVDIQGLRSVPFIVGEDVDPAQFAAFAAGVPRYIGVFGRDILITSWQSAMVRSSWIEPALSRVAAYRGKRYDPWRDEEPDRLPHELRLNPDAALGRLNRYLYYGDVTSTPFWVIALLSAWYWTGDRRLLERQKPALETFVSWIERRIHEGCGFIYYEPAMPGAPGANRNQAWKDSGDAIVDPEGRIVTPPLAVPEVQGYAYQALLGAAEIFEVLDKADVRCRRLRLLASELKERFNQRFWIEEEQFYALALGRDSRKIATIASNAGHCLGNGIVSSDRIVSVVRRLLAPDLFSGWGIRTLSDRNPAYDPFSYHRGSVWPVENAMIASGMSECDYFDEANRVIGAQLAVASVFEFMRLPEALSGHARSERFPTPGIYPYGNPIQSWSVSAIFMFIQTLLGIRPDAPRHELYIDPHLPDWMDSVELRSLKIGDSEFDIHFKKSDGDTRWEILRHTGRIQAVPGKPKRTTPGTRATREAG